MSAAARFTAALALTAAASLSAPHSALGSAGSIVAGNTTIVSSDAPANPYAESFLAIDPKNPASLIATALTIGNGRLDSALYDSQDGGRHWTRIRTGRYYSTADPIVYFAPDGRAFFESERSGGSSVMTSGDGGKTWTRFRYTRVGSYFDRPYMGFAPDGPFAGHTYLSAYVELDNALGNQASALAFASSADDGETYSTPQIIDVTPERAKAAVAIPADVLVEPDGAILLPYLYANFDPSARTRAPARYEVLASHDGGMSFGKAVTAAHATILSGNSYRGLSLIGGIRGTVDSSQSRYRGRAYLVYTDVVGSGSNIDVVHSDDDGRTWSSPVRVNDNAAPADEANAAIWVNDRGVIGVVWNDRRASHGTGCYRLYASASLDGGRSFMPNAALSAHVTCPNAPGNWKPVLYSEGNMQWAPGETWLDVLTVATRWPNGGDTQGLQSEPDGTFDAAWIDGSSGVMQLAFTRFTVVGAAPMGAPAPRTEPPVRTQRDLASQVRLQIVSGTFDPHRGRFTVALRIKNVSSAPIRGPFAVVFERANANLPNLRATNPDTTRHNHSAWILGTAAPLPPGAATAARSATWTFSGYPKAPRYPVFVFRVEQVQP
jgi:hypothetical protein